MSPILRSRFGAFTRPDRLRGKFPLTRITLALIARTLASSGERHTSYAKLSEAGCHVRSRRKVLDGISITKAFGSLEPLAQRAFERGRLPQRLATVSRPHR